MQNIVSTKCVKQVWKKVEIIEILGKCVCVHKIYSINNAYYI